MEFKVGDKARFDIEKAKVDPNIIVALFMQGLPENIVFEIKDKVLTVQGVEYNDILGTDVIIWDDTPLPARWFEKVEENNGNSR